MKALPIAAIAIWASLGCLPASAQTRIDPLTRPDATSVTVPNLAFTPTKRDISDFGEYFYFHKDGVSYEHAFADLEQCRINATLPFKAQP